MNELASCKPTPLSLKNMYLYAISGSSNSNNAYPKQRLRNAVFLHRELPIRIAQRAAELHSLPYGLARTTSVRRVSKIYEDYVSVLSSLPAPDTEENERRFTECLRGMVMDRSDVPQAVNEGLKGLKDARREVLTPRR